VRDNRFLRAAELRVAEDALKDRSGLRLRPSSRLPALMLPLSLAAARRSIRR
jgi:hypothetical protein